MKSRALINVHFRPFSRLELDRVLAKKIGAEDSVATGSETFRRSEKISLMNVEIVDRKDEPTDFRLLDVGGSRDPRAAAPTDPARSSFGNGDPGSKCALVRQKRGRNHA